MVTPVQSRCFDLARGRPPLSRGIQAQRWEARCFKGPSEQPVPRGTSHQKLVQKVFPWAQVRTIMENVASMSDEDRSVMTAELEVLPWHIDASGISICRRPRLYWVDWELQESEGVVVQPPVDCSASGLGYVFLQAEVDQIEFLQPGWKLAGDKLPIFTTSRPRPEAGRRPAGLHQCSPEEVNHWQQDDHRYPPYQYV